jgi:hypothetical protein
MADAESSTQSGYKGLKSSGGYSAPDNYPKDFQAVDFPKLAGKDGNVTTLGNDQAYFLAQPNGNTDHLKALLENIRDNNTHFTMMVDAEALRDPAKYAAKQHFPGENDPQGRETRLREQAERLGELVSGGEIRTLTAEVLREKNPNATDKDVDRFLQENFKLKAVETNGAALPNAAWQVDGPEGALLGRQDYKTGKWQVGTEPELEAIRAGKGSDSQGAGQLLDAVKEMNGMTRTDVALGPKQEKGEAQTHPAPDLHALLGDSWKNAAEMLGAAVPVDAHGMAPGSPAAKSPRQLG